MSVELPKPIAQFVDANAKLDLEAMLSPFEADAVIIDNGHRFEGQSGLRRLFEESVLPVKAIFSPDTLRNENGQVVVEGPAHGDFKGSPLRFTYRFTLVHDSIKALEISL
ncbi:nuclear transport factor 2 family protein [Sphingomonas sp. SM33]|uniref:Nuclear transport factor 2 family protein n=1 Tax=Sphingomonas telluris TaxID=2907998 RepID=A0ABS9VNJ1_9SPHN|nr:nuclear transport factor 2 family protein [Sphingomonas telluris]MCH8616527.1 nuclear transport factor 2 family protein [Sphingomonas telluris]